jgi:hypothetical protein
MMDRWPEPGPLFSASRRWSGELERRDRDSQVVVVVVCLVAMFVFEMFLPPVQLGLLENLLRIQVRGTDRGQRDMGDRDGYLNGNRTRCRLNRSMSVDRRERAGRWCEQRSG